jgi:WD repeat-containing protein 68
LRECSFSLSLHYFTLSPSFLSSSSPDPKAQFRLAIGSYVEQYSNAVQIVKKRPDENSLYLAGEFDHPYPCTKILWSPDVNATKDLLATTGDYLRVWSVTDDGSATGTVTPTKVALLNNVRLHAQMYGENHAASYS